MAECILVWSDDDSLLAELLGEASRLAVPGEQEVGVCSLGAPSDVDQQRLASLGADVVYVLDAKADSPGLLVAGLTAAMAEVPAGLFLIGATRTGMEVAPRVAERVGAGYAPWTTGIQLEGSDRQLIASCMLFAGFGRAVCRYGSGPTIVTSALGVFEAVETVRDTIRVEAVGAKEVDSRVEIVEEKAKDAAAGLEQARVIVDCGKGIRERDDLEMVRSLAQVLDGELACSRPLSSDRDWFADWLGLSGTKVRAELCLTLGISGAVQHVVGIRESRVVAAVNNDPDAAIFTQADVGVMADLYEFVPALMERLKARHIRSSS